MDYGELLYKAQANEQSAAKQEVRCYKTAFAPPKKLERTVSSANVKKFLARKENEEKRKLLEAEKKKEELLALRQQDKKAKRRIESMLKRTKSANMSVMEDAIDNNNTADTLCGPMQCDEDDYGYVSQEASAFYAKLINKYNNMPPEPSPFSEAKKEVKDLSAAKARVKAALRKEEEEAELPHKRKRKHKDKDGEPGEDDEDKVAEQKALTTEKKGDGGKHKSAEPVVEKKKKIAAPPPPSFEQIMKMAEQKKSQFIDFEKIIRTNAATSKEPERPMTQKEKIEWQRQQEAKINQERRKKGLPPLPSSSKSQDSSTTSVQSASKKSKGEPKVDGVRKSSLSASNGAATKPGSKERSSFDSGKVKKPEVLKSSSSSSSVGGNHVRTPSVEKKPEKRPPRITLVATPAADIDDIDREIELLRKKKMLLEKNRAAAATVQQNRPTSASNGTSKKPTSSSLYEKPPSRPETKSQPTSFKKESSSSRPTVQQRPKLAGSSNPTRPSHLPPMKPKPSSNFSKLSKPPKRRIDSESDEYDSELDDFIDDGDDNAPQDELSDVLRSVFGYDKSRYSNINDDEDECMESNFAQQMKEEFVSTKIGIMEDLEDIRKEQEEKRRLKLKKMKAGKTK